MAFAERYLRVPRGHGALGPVRLRPWQRRIVRGALSSGVRTCLVSVPRGNGKSTLAAVVGLYGLFADGVEGAQVLVVASDERQAGIVFNLARRMVELNPALAEQVQLYKDRIYVPGTDSELRPLPAEPDALQGWDPTLLIVDELHVVTEAVWESVSLAAGKRPTSLTLAISTPADSKDTVMWRLVEHGRRDDDPSFKLFEWSAPQGCAADDEAAWKVANPALGDFLAVDALRATYRTTREGPFRRFRMGQWVGRTEGWLPWGAWDGRADPDRVVPDGARIVAGFDGSVSGDSTALVGCTVTDPPHVFVIGLWERDEPGWRVNRADVDAAVAAMFDRFDVVELAVDPWHWRSELELWADRHGARRVVEWPTNVTSRMGPATDRLYAAVAEDRVTHDGHPGLARHVANCVAKRTTFGDVIVKDGRSSPRKIDAAVAAIVAVDRAAHHASRRRRLLVVN